MFVRLSVSLSLCPSVCQSICQYNTAHALFFCRVTEARIQSDVYSIYYIFCHGDNIYARALQYYVIRELPVIFYGNIIFDLGLCDLRLLI